MRPQAIRTGGPEVVGTPGMNPNFTEIFPGVNFACYLDGSLPIAWGDYDLDGYPDLPLYHNDGGTFSEIPGVRQILNQGNYHGAAWGDYDGDGWPDVVILGYASVGPTQTRLLHNQHDGTFQDVAPALGLAEVGFGETPIWGDYDGDGHLDLFAPYYNSSPPFSSLLYHNNGDGTFTESCTPAGVCLTDLPDGFTPEGAQWADWNDDGYLDFYAAGHLFQNDGSGHFTDVSASVGLPFWFDEGVQFVDYDSDGKLDLYIRATDGGHLFRNTGSQFVDVTATAGIPISFLWGDNWADVNHDGFPDLVYMRYNQPALLLINQRDGTFLPDPSFTALNLLSDASAFADWDRDGDLDLAAVSFCPRFFRNNLDQNAAFPDSYLNVRVLDAAGHETQHGATVRLRRVDIANPYIQTRVVDSGSGYLGQNEYPVHFGVAAYGTYELEVSFPSLAGSHTVVDKTTDARLGALVPRQLTTKEITIYRGGCALINQPSKPRITVVSGTNPSCAGEPVTLDAGAGYASYLWSTGQTTRMITASPLSQTTYFVRVGNACAQTIGGHTQKVVSIRPTASLTGAETICAGSAAMLRVDLEGEGPWTLQWSDGFVQNPTVSPATRTVTPSTTTTYSLQSVFTAVCTDGVVSGSATVTVASCSGGTVAGSLIADGRAVTGQLLPGGNSYAATVMPNRSYAAEIDVPAGASGPTAASPLLFITQGDGLTPLSAPALDAADCSAAVSDRLTFFPTGSDLARGPLFIHALDLAASGYPIRMRLVETTLFCPRWSVNGYTALIDLQNTTECQVTGEVVLQNSSGSAVATFPFSLAGHNAAQLVIPSNLSPNVGSALLTHDGAPGAISAAIYMAQPPGASGANFRWPFQEVRSYGATDGR